jgi:hypothetical protein
VWSLLLLSEGALGQVPTASLFGRVRDADGAVVFAATARLLEGETQMRIAESDRLGFFRMERLPPGEYDLSVGPR